MTRPLEIEKVLSANDLGLTGSHQAGIAIPKDPRVLAFFPRLDPNTLNPDTTITVRTPQTDAHWQLRYVYYNTKPHGLGTRNEYRLTGTTRMLRELGASVGDSIRFRRDRLGDVLVTLEHSRSDLVSPPSETILRNGWRLRLT